MRGIPEPVPKTAGAPPAPDSGSGGDGLLGLVNWFVLEKHRGFGGGRGRIQVFVIAQLLTGPLALALALFAHFSELRQVDGLSRFLAVNVGFALFPFALRLWGRFDVVAAAAAQLSSLIDLTIAYFYGGLMSPALPWLMVAFVGTIYYLAPWPRWQAVNVALQVAEIGAFVVLTSVHPAPLVPDRSLILFWLSSSLTLLIMVYAFFILSLSMNINRQRHLQRAVAASRAAEAESQAQREALSRSREHLVLAQKAGRMGSVERNLVTGQAIWSDGMIQLLGIDPSTAQSPLEAVLAVTHPDDRAALRRLNGLARAGIKAEPFEFRLLGRDGGERWLLRTTELIYDAEGTARSHIVTYQDITDRRRAEADLRQREAELHRLSTHLARAQRTAQFGSIEQDLETGEAIWSQGLYAILGLDPATVAPTFENHLQVTHPDDRALLLDQRKRSMAGEATGPVEIRVIRPDGTVRWTSRQAEVERAPDGRLLRLTATFQDITEQKRLEQERSSLQRQLIQSQKLDSLGQLAGGVAHDFNNLLAVLSGRLELIEGQVADRPEVLDWVRSAIRTTHRGASLTKMMLAFAREQPLLPVAFDPSAAVRDLAGMLRRTLGENIEVKVVGVLGQWQCKADPGQLQNALLNLAVNARDAMPDGGTLTIESGNVRLEADAAARVVGAKPGDYVVVSVTDSGSGMPREVLERAFEPFYTTKDTGKGTGLGLSMVDGFVRQSGGYVTIDSEVGRGTTVRIYLPRAPDQGVGPGPAETRPVLERGHETILVVEDNDEMREVAARMLGHLGYTVLSAADAAAGLRHLRRHPEIALLLCDLVLPGGIDGVEAAKDAVALRPDLRVIFMSGYSERARLPDLVPGAGPPLLLGKPFNFSELAAHIRAALDRG